MIKHILLHQIFLKRKVLSEGAALGCDKKPYSYARKAFDKTKKDIYSALTREGFIVENVYDAGSLRRKKSIIGDLDFLVNVLGHQKIGLLEGNNPDQERIFTEQYQWLFGQALKKHIVTEVCKTRKNITQFISENMQCDVFLCTPTAIPTRRCYWTGSAAHNVKILYEVSPNVTRQLAIRANLQDYSRFLALFLKFHL